MDRWASILAAVIFMTRFRKFISWFLGLDDEEPRVDQPICKTYIYGPGISEGEWITHWAVTAMSIFDAIAIEAAQNCFNQTADAELALWSATQSLRERQLLRDDVETVNSATSRTSPPVSIQIPVAIIRLTKEKTAP